MKTPIIETPVVCITTIEETSITNEAITPATFPPDKKVGRPRQHANAAERQRAKRARDKAALDKVLNGVPVKAPRKNIYGSEAARVRAYRVKKAVGEHRQYRPKIEPPGPTGTQSDWNRYLESVGLGLDEGIKKSVRTSYKGTMAALDPINTALEINNPDTSIVYYEDEGVVIEGENRGERYIARKTTCGDNSDED